MRVTVSGFCGFSLVVIESCRLDRQFVRRGALRSRAARSEQQPHKRRNDDREFTENSAGCFHRPSFVFFRIAGLALARAQRNAAARFLGRHVLDDKLEGRASELIEVNVADWVIAARHCTPLIMSVSSTVAALGE